MLQLLQYIQTGLFVVFFFGFCIFIHEFGHLIVALWRGMRAETFSIGFGKPFKKWHYKGVDYYLSWVPFGGYVRLPQLEPGDEPMTSEGEKLPVAKPLDRILVAVAGPFFNILFGLALGVVVWQVGVPGTPKSDSVVVDNVPKTYINSDGETVPTPEYVAGLRKGDIIRKVNGKSFTNGYRDVTEMIIYATDPQCSLEIERDGKTMTIDYELAPNPNIHDKWFPFFDPKHRITLVSVREPSAAFSGGVQPGDVLLSIDGEDVTGTRFVNDKVKGSEGKELALEVRRPVADAEPQVLTLLVTPRMETLNGEDRYLLGVEMGYQGTLHPTPIEQLVNTFTMTYKTLRSLTNRRNPISVSDMSGPVGIAHAMSVTFKYKFMAGLQLVVLISFSLAIVNMLPIPVLDGGHITYGVIEMVTRQRIPSRIVWGLQNVFAVLIISFALYVTFFDVGRIFAPAMGAPPPTKKQSAPADPGATTQPPADSAGAPVEDAGAESVPATTNP